jgi:hypothetical protein
MVFFKNCYVIIHVDENNINKIMFFVILWVFPFCDAAIAKSTVLQQHRYWLIASEKFLWFTLAQIRLNIYAFPPIMNIFLEFIKVFSSIIVSVSLLSVPTSTYINSLKSPLWFCLHLYLSLQLHLLIFCLSWLPVSVSAFVSGWVLSFLSLIVILSHQPSIWYSIRSLQSLPWPGAWPKTPVMSLEMESLNN